MGIFQSSFLGIWNLIALASNCLFAMMICFCSTTIRWQRPSHIWVSSFFSFSVTSTSRWCFSCSATRNQACFDGESALSKQPVIQKKQNGINNWNLKFNVKFIAISDWMCFLPIMDVMFLIASCSKNPRLTHHLPPSGSVQLVPGLPCHRLRKIAMLMTVQNATANSDHCAKSPNVFQGFHHFFAPPLPQKVSKGNTTPLPISRNHARKY